jgi:hypothetical protein
MWVWQYFFFFGVIFVGICKYQMIQILIIASII